MKNGTEFLVGEMSAVTDGFVVHGMTNSGVVAVGDRFGRLHRRIVDDETETFDINLEVISIVAYRRNIEELPEGMGGELKLKGICPTTLQENDMLC